MFTTSIYRGFSYKVISYTCNYSNIWCGFCQFAWWLQGGWSFLVPLLVLSYGRCTRKVGRLKQVNLLMWWRFQVNLLMWWIPSTLLPGVLELFFSSSLAVDLAWSHPALLYILKEQRPHVFGNLKFVYVYVQYVLLLVLVWFSVYMRHTFALFVEWCKNHGQIIETCPKFNWSGGKYGELTLFQDVFPDVALWWFLYITHFN